MTPPNSAAEIWRNFGVRSKVESGKCRKHWPPPSDSPESPSLSTFDLTPDAARINTLDTELELELDMEPDIAAGSTKSQALADATARLIAIYHAVQPILDILSTLPLLPQRWRDALRQFVATLDQVASFKAGKDL
jgi:hypothetical protein